MNGANFWPASIQGAVCLTFDDGCQSQLDNAIPCLDDAGLRGTFYVNPGRSPGWERNLEGWQLACIKGHEIGNHTTEHPCSCNYGFRPDGYCLENLTFADMEETIDAATAELDRLFPEQRGRRTFSYPCYQTYVGAGENRRSYVPLVARRFKAARGRGERPNNPAVIDLSYTWSYVMEGSMSEEAIDYIEGAMERGQWAIVCMHGVGADHISTEVEAFRRMVLHLDRNRDRIWTGTMISIAEYVLARRPSLAAESH